MYQPDEGLKMLYGRIGALLVLMLTQILAAKFGMEVDDETKKIAVDGLGALIAIAGMTISGGMIAMSKYREKKKIKAPETPDGQS